MITTLPGTYLHSVGLLTPLAIECSVDSLRQSNWIFAALNPLAIMWTLGSIRPGHSSDQLVESAVISLLPVLFFFNFL